MKALIFKYNLNNINYYVEGYDEETMRACLEQKLNVPTGTLIKGIMPDFNKELKRIWNKEDKAFFLTLKKEETTDEASLQRFKIARHVLYELDLLLAEDKEFFSGVNDIVIKDPDNRVELWNQHEGGWPQAYSYQGSTKDSETNKIYRWKHISNAYWHVRNQLIEHRLADLAYKGKDLTNLEMCDSFVAGFGSADIVKRNGKIVTRHESHLNLPLELHR